MLRARHRRSSSSDTSSDKAEHLYHKTGAKKKSEHPLILSPTVTTTTTSLSTPVISCLPTAAAASHVPGRKALSRVPLRTRVLPGDVHREPLSTRGCLQHLPHHHHHPHHHPCAFPGDRTGACGMCFPLAELCSLMLHFSLCIHTFKSLCRAASSVDKGADATTRATNPARAQPPAAASPLPAAQGKLQSRDCKSCCRHSVAAQGLSVASGSLACGSPGYHAPARASRLVPEPEHQHQAQPERLREPRPRSHPRDSTPASISRPSTRKLQRRAHPWMLRASCTTPHPLYYFF